MRKLKLLFAALCLLVGGNSAWGYTTSDLTSAGWTQVTATSITGIDDNYYMLVDCNSSNYVMANQADHFRPCYKTIADPIANPSFVWILEGSDNEFNLKSYSTGAYFKQASGWNTSVGYARDSRTKVTGVFELSDGKYTLKCKESGSYVGHWNDDGAAVASDGENIAANKTIEYAPGFYLYSISRATFDAALAASRLTSVSTATKASPASVTSYIQNADWSNDWGGWESTFTSSGNMQWGKQTLESWNASNVIIKQELRGVPNGSYKLTADLISGNNENKVAYVFATGDTKVSSDAVSVVASAGDYTTMSNEVAGKTLTADNVIVTNNAITVGIDQSEGWIVADNFTLSYYGPNLATVEALPNGDMAADTWYYFDVTIAGEYNLTCTTLSDIVYSTNGSILIEDAASITTSFASSTPELSVGRHYVKSSSAQTLTVAAASYSYTVGTATSSITGTYVQSLTSVALNFADATTNDGSAELALSTGTVKLLDASSSEVATAALSLSGSTITATFSDLTLTAGTSYTIAIADNVLGYAAGDTYNAAQNITFNTPAVFDGVYYMYNTDTKTYLSRSGNYATQAIMDNWGLAFNVSTDASNNTKLQYFDSEYWLGDDGFCYGDCTGNRVRSYNVAAVTGGYKFLNTNNSKYLAVNGGAAVADAVEGDNLQGTSNIWALESTTAHMANYTANADAQVKTATANIPALSAITTKTALETELANNYGETSITITGSKAEKFQQYATYGDGGALAENTYYSETVSGLKPGLYKLSVDAFQRAASNAKVAAADGARSLIYLYAGNANTQLKSIMDYGANEAYASDFSYDGKHYPDNEASAYAALATNNYKNDVYVYVADAGEGTGSLEIGIKNPTRLGGNFATWAVYNNWTLTLYEAKATDEQKTALTAAITAAEAKTLGFETGEYAPYTNVAALKALANAKAITPETASGSAVTAATTALTGATWTANAADVECVYNGNFAEGQGSAAANIQQHGWTRTNGWGQFKNDGYGSSTAYYNQPGSMQYGNAGVYTMPLKAQTIYRLQFKYAKWDGDFAPTVSVLNGEDGMAAQTFANASSNYKDGYNSVDMVFVTATAGNYVLSLNASSNYVITGVSITKAANQYLEFADGSVPNYAPGKYPEVKITRTLKANKWVTAVYPFELYYTRVGKIAVLSSYDKSTGALGFADYLHNQPNVPFLMKSTTDKSEISQTEVSGVDVKAAAATDATASEASLKGVYAATTVDKSAKNYVLSNNKIYAIGANSATVNPYRAYIQIAQDAEARNLTFTVDGEVTAIEGITAGESGDGVVYNLQGQRVVKAQKGLYIKDGRKVMIK